MSWRRLVRSSGAALLAGALIVVVLPRVTGAPWRAIAAAWQQLSWRDLPLLSALWFAGLVVHSSVLMAALPGLSRRRALTLNLTGSVLANVVPLGGGLGVWLNYSMVRRWGFSAGQFSLYTVISNVCNVFAKALLPAAAVTMLLVSGTRLDHRLVAAAVGGSALLMTTVLAGAALASSDRTTRLAGRRIDEVAALLRRPPRPAGGSQEHRLVELRRHAATIVRAGWRSMTLGMLSYYALCGVLLWTCLRLLGSELGPLAVIALLAVERAMTALPITPGGSGLVEVATTGLAVAFGGSSATSAAGVLLYRAFTFGLEIPVGAVWLLAWLVLRRMRPDADPPREPARAAVLDAA